MDNSASRGTPAPGTIRWAPRPALVAVGWLLAALSAVGCAVTVLTGDRAGALLFGVAAVALAGLAAHGTFVRPRLAADQDGVVVRRVSGTTRLPWPEVWERIRTVQRLGRLVSTLELESEDHLVVFGWLELGEDPRDVLEALAKLRHRR